jgi:peptidoglycan-N-acetylglucosamine deacetylase
MKNAPILMSLLLLAWLAFSTRAHGKTSLTITLANLPDSGRTANGQSVAFAGTLNDWNNASSTATVSGGRLVFSFPDIASLPVLDSSWGDTPANANAGFQFLVPGSWESAIKTDFISNEGNFRVALVAGTENTVEIDAGPVPTLVDQASAVCVNGSVERYSPPIDLARFAFPGGRWKAVVMSYDDGHVQDRGVVPIFNAHGIKGTFHLNSNSLDYDTFITRAEIPSLYAGHEVSSHTVDHPYLDQLGEGSIRWEIETDRQTLASLCGYAVRSLSYPFGAYNNLVLSTLRDLGVGSARTTKDTWNLHYLPPDPLKWHPTCHHTGAMSLAQQLVAQTEEKMSLLYIWGHSYELDYGYSDNSWAYMASLCETLGDRGDIWYAGMAEMNDYVAAIRSLTYPSTNCVYNPSGLAVWAKLGGGLCRIQPGKRMTWPAGSAAATPEIPQAGVPALIRYVPAGNALADASAVVLHVGHDGWQDVTDVAMTKSADGAWTAPLPVPGGAQRLHFAFTDGQGVWDDNGGQDWSLAVKAATTGTPATVQLAIGSPAVSEKSGSDQNNAGDAFDLRTSGGALTTTVQGRFGSFGSVYVNADEENLYIGATNCDTGGNNNALILFLSLDTMSAGVENLWNLHGTPFGLDHLHNVALSPAAHVAIVIGDEFGDGHFPHFNLESGSDFGQGVFYLSSAATAFPPVPGARLSQFDGSGSAAASSSDDDGNRQTDRWEAAIPWRSLNAAAGWRSVRTLHVSGLIASEGVSGSDRFLSGNFLGTTASGTLSGGNYGFGFVTLTGVRIGIPFEDSDLDGMPDLQESMAGTDAADANSRLEMAGIGIQNGGGVLRFDSVSGKQYRIQYKLDLAAETPWTDLPGTLVPTGGLCIAAGLLENAAAAFYRIRLDAP